MRLIFMLLTLGSVSLTGCCGPRCTPAVCYLPAPCAVPGVACPRPCEPHVHIAPPPARYSEPMHPAYDTQGSPYLIPQSQLGGILDAAAAPAGP